MNYLKLLVWPAAAALGGLVAVGLSVRPEAPDPSPVTSVHAYWYMGRAAGFVAYGLLFGSVVLGLAVSSRVFDGLMAGPGCSRCTSSSRFSCWWPCSSMP